MTSNLTEAERQVWKDAYTFFEKYHGCSLTDQDFIKMAKDYGRMYVKSGKSKLCMALLMALMDYFDEVYKDRQRMMEEDLRESGEQIYMFEGAG
jgi:Ca2+-binding EF-hand superfamily protein